MKKKKEAKDCYVGNKLGIDADEELLHSLSNNFTTSKCLGGNIPHSVGCYNQALKILF
ncbi:hypothetical protein ES332_D07G003800v1 [Gossypium tomentosum]|uniref:Uncharacterized protein n=1 Tax=Gossypium tomentosum TaxID=34277 RepID=A0A5D2K480_GOSTO|nr:hypothetical protein ES332_D07G003800v1 [Gossypium tomentosum]